MPACDKRKVVRYVASITGITRAVRRTLNQKSRPAKKGFKHCWTKVAGASTENSLLHIDKSKWSVGENRTKLTHAGINRACVSNLARMISECGVRCQRVTRGR